MNKSTSSTSNSESTTSTFEDSNNPLFKFENGRRYLNDDSIQYVLPNDDEEIDRLQMQHYLFRYIWQSNFSAPVKEILKCGAKVLDIGCGPGTWVLEMASDYPRSNIMGIDIAPIFPSEIKPMNAEFKIQNITHRLPFDDNSFDYIHMRLMLAVLQEEEWKNIVLPELFRILKPGGYIESQEFDFRIVNQGPCMKKLAEGFILCCNAKNINPIICPRIPGYLHENGFVSVNVLKNTAYYGSSSGRFGKLALEDFVSVFNALKIPISSIFEMSEDEYQSLLDNLQEEVDNNETFYKVYRFIGTKPI
ncbi:S-adenosyl-L-methionine-dependent methyltransferase [Glomus cerebriforme]|uniref:S-adenosyl-L-methionine-dependent methyltransferase n=1 Tax=Glomus cerebriforme TaxID=658196 RepID=A0A397SY66_9GLOM|nr:S-adenosyl-L-methionine-dependent methyltransferase [Glomus cerebriforme]